MATYNLKNLLAHTDQLAPADFKRQGNEPYYIKRLSDRELRMYFSVSQYYPHSAVIFGLNGTIYIPDIETIFDDVLLNNPIVGLDPNKKKDTIGGGGANIPNVDRELLKTQDVEDDATFAIVKPELEKIVQGALQFYNDYATLQAIYDHVESLPVMQMGKFLKQPMPDRRMILKKLVNAPDYESYAQLVLQASISESWPQDQINFVQALKTKLDSL